MASKLSPQCTERNEKSRIVLPCIGEDALLNQPASSSPGSIPKTPQQRLRVNSEPFVSSRVKNTSVKSKDAVVDAAGKSKMTTNHTRKVPRSGPVPVGVSTEKDCYHGNTKTTKGSRNVKRQVKLTCNTPSPDVIDLSNEDVVKELMIRLYKTLRVQDNTTYNKIAVDDCTVTVEETSKQIKPNAGRRKPDSEINQLFRHHTTRFPHFSKATSGLEMFYSKPASWKSMISSQQHQPSIRAKHLLAFQERSTKRNQEKMVRMNYRQLTWPFKDSARLGRSTWVFRKRGLSVPFIVTDGSAFVSSRKSVTFAE